jgi:hypothetical protein
METNQRCKSNIRLNVAETSKRRKRSSKVKNPEHKSCNKRVQKDHKEEVAISEDKREKR